MERKHQIAALSDHCKLLELIIHSIRDGIICLDPLGSILLANKAAKRELHVRKGDTFESHFPTLWTKVLDVLVTYNPRTGIPYSSGNRHYLVQMIPIVSDELIHGCLCVFENVTQLEKIAKEIPLFKSISMELEGIIESSRDGIWICDNRAKVLRINKASERLNDVKAEEVVGRTMYELVEEGFVDKSVTLEVIRTKKPAHILQETRAGRKLMVTGRPIFDENHKLKLIVVNERDITEIEALHRDLEEQKALKESYRQQILEMQIAELESHQIIAKSPVMINTLKQALKVSKVDSTVLIQGESGTGKELIAELIHKYSYRAKLPLIKINCGALPESLVESELFGYEKGAFTGAHERGKPGCLEIAHGGTILLDEIAELPIASQVKLLRFLEDGHIRRIGGTSSKKVDVRIIAATNRDIKKLVTKGLFRKDLFYRLNVIPIHIPPLRERKECIPALIEHYLEFFSKKYGRMRPMISKSAYNTLMAYSYPGNVRELINICERIVVMSENKIIEPGDLPLEVVSEGLVLPVRIWQEGKSLKEMMDMIEHMILSKVVRRHKKQSDIAKALGLDQSTVSRKLAKHGIKLKNKPNQN